MICGWDPTFAEQVKKKPFLYLRSIGGTRFSLFLAKSPAAAYHYPSAKSRVVLTGNYGISGNTKIVLLSRYDGIRKMDVLGFFAAKTTSLSCIGKVSRIYVTWRVCAMCGWCRSVLLRVLLRAYAAKSTPTTHCGSVWYMSRTVEWSCLLRRNIRIVSLAT